MENEEEENIGNDEEEEEEEVERVLESNTTNERVVITYSSRVDRVTKRSHKVKE
jgi:hypothetical protein